MPYLCPICQTGLTPADNSLKCENNHSFDYAKEGYVNLLPANKKKTQDPGDNTEMMQARRQFLDGGFYQRLSNRVNNLADELTSGDITTLDVGCGEGYYTQRLFERLSENRKPQSYGLDIAKTGIRYAAKRYKTIAFSVASAYELPFADESFDLLTRIYAPCKLAEARRVLKPGGLLLTVAPGPNHLFELKQKVYREPRKHELKEPELEGFELISQERLQYPLVINEAKDIDNFLTMTPFSWRLREGQKEELTSSTFSAGLDFNIEVFRKL